MRKLLNLFSSPTQTTPILGSGQVQNRAGGYVWQVDVWKQLERFLVLGATEPTQSGGGQVGTACVAQERTTSGGHHRGRVG